MTHQPPLDDSIATAIGRMVDDAQAERRDPSHSDIEFCIKKCGLAQGDPNLQGQTLGKAKRVRFALSWAIDHSFENGRSFVGCLLDTVRGCGGFRPSSPNYVGEEAIANLRDAMAAEGFALDSDGILRPMALDSLSGAALTDALAAYVRRAQKGAEDAALVVGTGKDLLEALAAHVVRECGQQPWQGANFPALLGQAFVALDLKTPKHKPVDAEPPQHRLQRALYDAACAVNTLRNKQGAGHGRPWLPTVTPEEARHATQVMGVVGELLLQALGTKQGA